MQPSLNTPAPELPARDAAPAPPIADTPPKPRATDNQILLPKALVDDVYREARKNFALIPDMTFALAAGARAVRDTWEHKDGKFLRKDKPFANYIAPKDSENDAPRPDAKDEPPPTEPATVAVARTRWDEAKKSGDPDRMTRASNDLLRAVEAEGMSTDATAEEILAPTSEEHVTSATDTGRVDAPHPNATIEDSETTLSPHASHESAVVTLSENDGNTLKLPSTEDLLTDAPAGAPDASTRHLAANSSDDRPAQFQLAGDQSDDDAIERVRKAAMEKHRLEEEIEYYRTNDPNNGGLERLKYVRSRARRPGQRKPQQVRYNDNWADPDVGWSSEEMRDQLIGAGQRDLTPETLLLLSAYAYPHGDAPPHLQVPPKSGWKVIATYDDSKGTGYYAMALYHERSNAVVIVNRGTEFPDGIGTLLAAGRDLGADFELFRKRLPAQMYQARDFIRNVNRIVRTHPEIYRRKHRQGVAGQEDFPSFVVTGHSLGGAAAQMQIATAATELKELKIRGVTFAAVGVASALFENQRDPQYARAVRRFADSRLINYSRRGDGLANRRNQWFQRPERIGRDRQLAGLEMDEIEAQEQWAERQEDGRGIAGATGGSTAVRARLLDPYRRNHSLLSYYDRQFATSLDLLMPQH